MSKNKSFIIKIGRLGILILFIFFPLFTYAKIKLSPLDFQAIVRIELYDQNKVKKAQELQKSLLKSDIEPNQFGTGFIIDYQGCILTAAHVLLKRPAVLDPYKYIKVLLSSDFALAPNIAYQAKIKYLDVKRDLGIICLKNTNGKMFHHFKLASKDELQKIDFGDEVVSVGYPSFGGDTISYIPGSIMGFWKNPNLLKFLGVKFRDDLSLLKIVSTASPGGSGSPLLDVDKKVLGVVFAGTFKPAGVTFVIDTSNLFISLEEDLKNKKNKGEINKNCQYDSDKGLYILENEEYYDNECKIKRNKGKEFLVSLSYETRCMKKIKKDDLYLATQTILSTSSTLNNWWQYLTKLCPLN